MIDHILAAYQEDISIRTTSLEGSNATGYNVNVHEIEPGDVYKDANVTVKPFLVKHGDWKQALGYRIEAPGRVIVYSGDTSPAESIVENCRGCDYLISESYTLASFNLISPHWQAYCRAYHTSTRELANIASRAKPRLIILTHRANPATSLMPPCLEAGSRRTADEGNEAVLFGECSCSARFGYVLSAGSCPELRTRSPIEGSATSLVRIVAYGETGHKRGSRKFCRISPHKSASRLVRRCCRGRRVSKARRATGHRGGEWLRAFATASPSLPAAPIRLCSAASAHPALRGDNHFLVRGLRGPILGAACFVANSL